MTRRLSAVDAICPEDQRVEEWRVRDTFHAWLSRPSWLTVYRRRMTDPGGEGLSTFWLSLTQRISFCTWISAVKRQYEGCVGGLMGSRIGQTLPCYQLVERPPPFQLASTGMTSWIPICIVFQVICFQFWLLKQGFHPSDPEAVKRKSVSRDMWIMPAERGASTCPHCLNIQVGVLPNPADLIGWGFVLRGLHHSGSDSELFVVGSWQQVVKVWIAGVAFGSAVITPSAKVHDVGAVFWYKYNNGWSRQPVSRSVEHQIDQIHRFLYPETCRYIVHTSVTSRLDVCSSLLINLPVSIVGKRQR